MKENCLTTFLKDLHIKFHSQEGKAGNRARRLSSVSSRLFHVQGGPSNPLGLPLSVSPENSPILAFSAPILTPPFPPNQKLLFLAVDVSSTDFLWQAKQKFETETSTCTPCLLLINIHYYQEPDNIHYYHYYGVVQPTP